MASRRRVAKFAFSPDKGKRASDLERKLELLEARFTMPLHFPPSSSSNHHNADSSPATLDPENSSPASVQSSSIHPPSSQHPPTSQQSFAFDPPSLPVEGGNTVLHPAASVDIRHSRGGGGGGGSDGNTAEHSWQDITAAHIARMQQESTNHPEEDSQSTLLTSHVHHDPDATTPVRAPPLATQGPPEHTVPDASQMGDEPLSKARNTKAAENKRKRLVPVKRPQPSVKDSIPPPDSAVPSPSPKRPNDEGRKRTRLNFDVPPPPPPNCSPSRISTISSSKSNSPRRISQSKSNVESVSSNSREPLTLNGSRSTMATRALAAITNNTKISDFFALTKPKGRVAQSNAIKSSTLPHVVDQDLHVDENVSSTLAHPIIPKNPLPPPPLNHSVSSTDTHELEALKKRYEELLRTCQDKEEQLKAVSNNRTILHTALQSALRQRESEYEALKLLTEEKDAKYREALEELVRSDACQEARELREKLAADGARLGRILTAPPPVTRGPPRMLLQHHRAHLESWEDGYATKELQEKRKELQAKKTILEDRQKAALIAEENFWKPSAIPGDVTHEDDKNSFSMAPPQGDVSHSLENSTTMDHNPVSALDVREAVESARYHLNNIRQQEKELALTEQALNDEKGAHIRALKRVASEDASRFRTRPKLHDRYVLRSLLGKGGFSEVWLAFDLIELREVAVKIHQLDSRWPDSKKENYTKHVSREYEIHRSVRHPRIVSLFDVFEIDNNSFATVLEACEGTDLDTLLKVKRRLLEKDARAILLQILCGMNYLSHPSKDGSRQGIIHFDLKPGNILFDQYGDAKITDFGLSKIVDAPDPGESMELTSQGAGTYWYLPPECFIMDDDVRISNKVDVWSIGVIFYQMLFGKRPFGDGQSQDKMLTDGTMLNARSVHFPERPEVSRPCKEFIEACLTYDQQFRPTIAQICEHPYVLSRED